jgi:hypothetical protein
MILGDDDILCENYVEIFLDKLNLYPTIDVFFSDFNILLNSTKELINHKHILPFGFLKNGFSIIEYGIKYGLGYPLISSIVKKRVFKGFYTLSHGSNDWLWVYENAVGLDFYGEDNKLLFYRYHNNNETKNMNTIFICQLSIIYIYSKTLSIHIAENKSLLKYFNKNIWNAKMLLYNKFDSKIYLQCLKNDNLYSNYLKDILNNNKMLKLYLKLPLIIRKINYKILQLLKLV